MINYLIRVSYDGSKYYGFQRLKNYPTIQSEIEKALTKIFKQEILVKGAGRTDKGVHALDQCASFEASKRIACSDLVKAINRYLPMDIRVTKCDEKNPDFHARFSVVKKIYEYRINVGKFSPFYINYYYQPKEKVNIKKLKKASKVFVGTHDFKNFVSGSHHNTISNILKINISKNKNILVIRIVGTSFYKYMVRNIVGALLDYNKDKITINDLFNMLNNPDNKRQLTTICPNGLYLTKIYY